MSTPIEGEPAFPNGPSGMCIQFDDGRVDHQYPGSQGMTLRQWYIGQALAGLCANPNFSQAPIGQLAHMAIEEADNLMSMLYPQTEKETNQ